MCEEGRRGVSTRESEKRGEVGRGGPSESRPLIRGLSAPVGLGNSGLQVLFYKFLRSLIILDKSSKSVIEHSFFY